MPQYLPPGYSGFLPSPPKTPTAGGGTSPITVSNGIAAMSVQRGMLRPLPSEASLFDSFLFADCGDGSYTYTGRAETSRTYPATTTNPETGETTTTGTYTTTTDYPGTYTVTVTPPTPTTPTTGASPGMPGTTATPDQGPSGGIGSPGQGQPGAGQPGGPGPAYAKVGPPKDVTKYLGSVANKPGGLQTSHSGLNPIGPASAAALARLRQFPQLAPFLKELDAVPKQIDILQFPDGSLVNTGGSVFRPALDEVDWDLASCINEFTKYGWGGMLPDAAIAHELGHAYVHYILGTDDSAVSNAWSLEFQNIAAGDGGKRTTHP
jgi:hypothetical protein